MLKLNDLTFNNLPLPNSNLNLDEDMLISVNFLVFTIKRMNFQLNFPTRKQNTLELLITNRPAFINKFIPVPGFDDHDTAFLSDLIHPAISYKLYILFLFKYFT